jgi:hypothetical protein
LGGKTHPTIDDRIQRLEVSRSRRRCCQSPGNTRTSIELILEISSPMASDGV